MALTTCPDCGNQYADDAPYCPNCGRPNPARQAANVGGTGTPGSTGPSTGRASDTPPAGTGSSYGTGSSAGTGSAGNTYGGGTGPSTAGNTYGGGTGGSYGGGTGPAAGEAPAGGGYGSTGGTYGSQQQGGASYGQPQGGYGGGGQGGGYAGGGGGFGGGGQPGGAGYGGQPPQNIPNYLVQAILVTLCCCLPLGIVAIVFATQVNTKRDAGDIQGAMAASANAKKFVYIAVACGAVAWLLYFLFFGMTMLAGIAGSASQGG